MENLDTIFNNSGTDKGSKYGHNFGPKYEHYLNNWRNTPINALEVGVQFGYGSMAWLEYFQKAEVYGVCLNKEHKITNPRYHFEVGDQSSRNFWDGWKQRNPKLNFVCEDGSHQPPDSKITLECLWPHMESGGVYAIEDTAAFFDYGFSPTADSGEWLRCLMAELNHHGLEYHGKPNPLPVPASLSYFAVTLHSMVLFKHLCILVKK